MCVWCVFGVCLVFVSCLFGVCLVRLCVSCVFRMWLVRVLFDFSVSFV